MSYITKPPPGTLLRGDSPLAHKLRQFYAMNEGAGKRLVNVAGDNRQGYSLMQDGVTWRGGPSGPCTAYNGSATIGQALMQSTGLYATNGNIFTFGVRFLVTTVAASTQAISGIFANQNPVFECCRAAGNVSVTGFGTIIADTAANTIAANQWVTFIYTRVGTGANSAIYLNGVKMALSTNSATNFSPTAAAMRIGARGDNGTPFIGLVDWLGVWDYALPAQMASLLTQDTWSLLVPRKTYFISTGGAAFSASISFATQSSLSPTANAHFGVSMTLANVSGVNQGRSVGFQGAVGLAASVAAAALTSKATSGSASFAVNAGFSPAAARMLNLGITLGASLTSVSAQRAGVAAGISLGQNPSLGTIAGLIYNESAALSSSLGISSAGGMTLAGAILLGITASQAAVVQRAVLGSAPFALQADATVAARSAMQALAELGVELDIDAFLSGGGTVDADISLGSTAGASAMAARLTHGALALGLLSGITSAARISIPAAINLLVETGLTNANQAERLVALALGIEAGLIAGAKLDAIAVAQMAAACGLTMSLLSQFPLELLRVFRVAAENRTYSVPAESRVYLVKPL